MSTWTLIPFSATWWEVGSRLFSSVDTSYILVPCWPLVFEIPSAGYHTTWKMMHLSLYVFAKSFFVCVNNISITLDNTLIYLLEITWVLPYFLSISSDPDLKQIQSIRQVFQPCLSPVWWNCYCDRSVCFLCFLAAVYLWHLFRVMPLHFKFFHASLNFGRIIYF